MKIYDKETGCTVRHCIWSGCREPVLGAAAARADHGGLLVTTTQIGYAIGILLIVPLGDILRRKRLIFILMLCSVGALAACAAAPSFAVLGLALASMGLVTVAGQVILPLSGDLSEPEHRGQIVGIVSSGITTGILLSRFVSGIVAALWGWRAIYVIAAVLNLIMAFVVFRSMPRVEPKEKIAYGALLKGVFTAFARFPVLPRILLQTGMVFGITFTILVTGGGFALYPMDEFLPLSMDKAALRAMCIALHNKLKEQDIYVGTLTVTDSIVPGGKCDPALLAEDFWKMYVERGECELMH